MYSNDNFTLNFVTYFHSHLLYKFPCSFEDGVADFAFKTLFGYGYACCASDFLLGFILLRRKNRGVWIVRVLGQEI